MGKVKILLALILLAPLVSTVWQIAACELANYALQDELADVASQSGVRIGLAAPNSDENLRDALIRKAGEHNISLKPEQVTVERSGPTDAPVFYLAADYKARVVLPGSPFFLHFRPASQSKKF